MARLTPDSISVEIKLDNGIDIDGNERTVSISLGNLNKDNFDADKALAVLGALEPCLQKTVNSMYVYQRSLLSWY